MKKHLIYSINVLFALIIILTINSCRKETLNFETKLSAKSLDLISEAKLHFDNSLKESPSDRGLSGKEEKNKFQLLGKKALWEYAKVKKMTVGESVRVPIFYDEENFIKAGKDKKAMSLYNLSYLMMYKDKKGKMQTEWVITIPDDDYVDRKRNSGVKFTGVIHVLDWKGNLIKSYRYQKDGSVLLGTQLTFGKENNLKVSGNQQPIKQFDYWAKDCVTNYYWKCSYVASNPSDVTCGDFTSVTTCYYSYVISPREKEDVPSGGGGGGEPTPTPGGGPSDYIPEDTECPVSGNPENPEAPLIGERSISTDSVSCQTLPPDVACLSSFQFSMMNSGPSNRVSEVYGLFGALVDSQSDAIITPLEFGLRIEVPITINYWSDTDHNMAHTLYKDLFNSGDIKYSYNTVTGVESWTFSTYAEQRISRDASDYAGQLVDKNLLREPINHEAYKQSFKNLFQSYMQTYNPGTRVLILNTKTPNSTTLKKVYSDGKGC